jgi:hypothetical protein
MMNSRSRRFRIAVGCTLALVLFVSAFRLAAQENFDIPIAFTGEVRAVNGSMIQVDLLWVETSEAQVESDLTSGVRVTVEGLLRIDGTILANVITASTSPMTNVTAVAGTLPTSPSTIAPTATAPAPTEVSAPASVIIVGPIQAVTSTTIVIYNIEIQLDPTLTNLPPLRAGEMVRVQAEQVDGAIVARNITRDPAS